jgi:hypothetical protein
MDIGNHVIGKMLETGRIQVEWVVKNATLPIHLVLSNQIERL